MSNVLGFFNALSLWVIIPSSIVSLTVAFFFLGIRIIANNRVGIVEKRWSTKGSVVNGFIAKNNESGFQPKILRGGIHWLMPFQYVVHRSSLVTIPQGKIGYIFARDGQPLLSTQTLANNNVANNFEDVIGFLNNGGQRGPQRKILREGTYAINLAQFVVITEEKIFSLSLSKEEATVLEQMKDQLESREAFHPVIIQGKQDILGVVTVHDGPGLSDGEIISPIVGDEKGSSHSHFQDSERFLELGGQRGRQLQVLVDGTYYINRLFATVEFIPKTVIDVGHVGVVISYTGKKGVDVSGSEYCHGELVKSGNRGVWEEALLPGKYAFNTYAGAIVNVPTTNFLLKWIKTEAGEHGFDQHLSEVSLITKDAFEPNLPLSVVVHIDYRKAPLVIQRFGDIQRLVEQTLDPMVSAYFKNTAQTRTLIQLLQERSDIQQRALKEMKEKFSYYNLNLEEVLIGTPKSNNDDKKLESILEQLRQRQIAQEQIETYAQQEKAAHQERQLKEAQSVAQQQTALTESKISVQVQSNQGEAEFKRSLQKASEIKVLAEAEANKVRVMAEADAEREARVGIAKAVAIEEQVRAYGGPQFQLTQQVMNRFAEAVQTSGVEIVPRVLISSEGDKGGNHSIMEALMTMLLSDRLNPTRDTASFLPPKPETVVMKKRILDNITKTDIKS